MQVMSVIFELLKMCSEFFQRVCSDFSLSPSDRMFHVRRSLFTIDYVQQGDLYKCHASDLHPHTENSGVTKKPSSDVEELSTLDDASPCSLEGRNANKPREDVAWCYATKSAMAFAKLHIKFRQM